MISVAQSGMIFQALREINVFYLFMHFRDKIWRAVLTSADEMAESPWGWSLAGLMKIESNTLGNVGLTGDRGEEIEIWMV